jgi:predicted small lipoprotein YifL
MMQLIGAAALVGLFLWLVGAGRRTPLVAPEDDVDTPVDVDALAEAERELAEDPKARPIHDAFDDDNDDDWGPGAGRSSLPGIL